jgi:DNA polymerase-3 subunit epsilon
MFRNLFGRQANRRDSSANPTMPGALVGRASGGGLHHAVEVERVVVVDTETTGLYTSDRVIEVGAVTFDLAGKVIDEWDTLINPRRDVGPTWLHGITASMVAGAPGFEDVAAPLAARLHGAVVVAHNLPFDARLLRSEFARLGSSLDFAVGIDTLRLVRCKLDDACAQYGIRRQGAHQALSDARATGELLFRVAGECHGPTAPARFLTGVPNAGADRRRPRSPGEDHRSGPPTWLAGLASSLVHDAADVELVGYLDVLNVAMADLHLDALERDELAALAQMYGLTPGHVALAHRRWLDDLLAAAAGDGVVDADEYDALCRAAAVLGVEQAVVDGRTALHRSAESKVTLDGCTVCFTGEPVDASGQPIPRSVMEEHARNIGLTPVGSVTKSGCQLLVASDPQSMSGKAGKARRFGIPIVAAAEFLAASAGDSLLALSVVVEQVDSCLCQECGKAWTHPRTRGTKPKLCEECHPTPVAPTCKPSKQGPPVPAASTMEVLICLACEREFERERTRGRKPTRCPACASS